MDKSHDDAWRWLEMLSCSDYRKALERHVSEEIAAYCAGDAPDDDSPSKTLQSPLEAPSNPLRSQEEARDAMLTAPPFTNGAHHA